MNTIISFTPQMAWSAILVICGGIISISSVIKLIIALVRSLKKPSVDQSERIGKLEKRVDRHDELFLNDKRSIEKLEEGTRVTQKALLALLDHSIEGNNTQQMKDAKDDLQRFLIER